MRKLVFVVSALAPASALAHAGHEHVPGGASILAGLAHPLTGLDHVLAMVAVGLWAFVLGGRFVWALPTVFVAAMALGGALGSAGLALPGLEPMILASVIALGAALALAMRPPLAASLAAVALFGLVHGAAHGLEGPASGVLGYGAGFLTATTVLHLAGIAAGWALASVGQALGPRLVGGAACVAGVVLVLA